jgi:hypothetical protein
MMAASTKPTIDSTLRRKLEELGADVIRAKLIAIMEVRDFTQHHELIPLGDGITATRQQLQQWLTDKAEEQAWYLRWTLIAAVAAVLVGIGGIIVTLLH